jgi:predicted RNA methylase
MRGGRRSGVSAAVEAFLAGVDLEAGNRVLAATARALSAKLDACTDSDAAAAAQAAPRVAAELVAVLERLQDRVPREPDGIDRLVQRHEARLLEMAAAHAHDDGRN